MERGFSHFFSFSGFHCALDQASSDESSSSEGLRDKWELVLALSARRDFTGCYNSMLDSGMADHLEMGIFFICFFVAWNPKTFLFSFRWHWTWVHFSVTRALYISWVRVWDSNWKSYLYLITSSMPASFTLTT